MVISYKHRNTPTYELDGETVAVITQDILYKEDGVVKLAIPKDEANRHYQKYLAWVAEGNTTEAAD